MALAELTRAILAAAAEQLGTPEPDAVEAIADRIRAKLAGKVMSLLFGLFGSAGRKKKRPPPGTPILLRRSARRRVSRIRV